MDKTTQGLQNIGSIKDLRPKNYSLRASSPIWASETSLARTVPCSRVLARLALLAQIGELARRLQKL